MRIAEASGTLWSGAGQIEMLDAGALSGISQRLSWRIVATAFLSGRLVYDIGVGAAQRTFPLALSLSRIELAGAAVALPAAALGIGVPQLAPLGLSGNLALQVSSLTIEREAVEVQATLQWLGAGSALATVSPLGAYEVSVSGRQRTLRAVLRTLAGPLQLDGQGSWTRGNLPVFDAIALVPPPQQEQLAPLLRLVAIERGPGRFELSSSNSAALR